MSRGEHIVLVGGPANGELASVEPDSLSFSCPFGRRVPAKLRGARFGRTKERDPHFGFVVFRFRAKEERS